MLIFMIEDSTPKARRVSEFVRSMDGDIKLCVYGSYHSGLKAIEMEAPDIVLLDMTLPNFDRRPDSREGRLRPLGGYELMRKLKRLGIGTQVIVVTQLEEFGDGNERVTFPEIMAKCAREFPHLLKGGVYYGQGADNPWQPALAKLIESCRVGQRKSNASNLDR